MTNSCPLGRNVSAVVGDIEGIHVTGRGMAVGEIGSGDGRGVGSFVGVGVGSLEGRAVGSVVGRLVLWLICISSMRL